MVSKKLTSQSFDRVRETKSDMVYAGRWMRCGPGRRAFQEPVTLAAVNGLLTAILDVPIAGHISQQTYKYT